MIEKKRPYVEFDNNAALIRQLGRAAVDGMKFLIKEAGGTIEFGSALIVNNDGTKSNTKKPK